ncbi:unnamed protein product, partial [Rotaria magnacalcarata]
MFYQSPFTPNIPVNAKWAQYGTTVAGGDGNGSVTNQLSWPKCLFMDNNQTMIIADSWNHRIIQWNAGDKNGQVVAGGKGQGNRLDQLSYPTEGMDEWYNGLVVLAQHKEKSSSTTSAVGDWLWMIRDISTCLTPEEM